MPGLEKLVNHSVWYNKFEGIYMGDKFITIAMVMMAVSLGSFLVWSILSIVKKKAAVWFLLSFVLFFGLFFVFLIVGGNMNKESLANGENSTAEEVTVSTSATEVSSEAEMILMMMTEDVAKQIVNYPATIDFNAFAWGFWRNDHVYAVQGIFTCTNAFGVKEEYTLRLICEASDDYSQISAKEVYLNGQLIKSAE